MPSPVIKSLSLKHDIPLEDIERYWSDAIKTTSNKENKSKSDFSDNDWAYVMGIVKNRIKNSKVNEDLKNVFINILCNNKDKIHLIENDIDNDELNEIFENYKELVSSPNIVLENKKQNKDNKKSILRRIQEKKDELKDIDEKIKDTTSLIKRVESIFKKISSGGVKNKDGKVLKSYEGKHIYYWAKKLNTLRISLKGKDRAKIIDLDTLKVKESTKNYNECVLDNNELLNINLIMDTFNSFKSFNINESSDLVNRMFFIYESIKNDNLDEVSKILVDNILNEEDSDNEKETYLLSTKSKLMKDIDKLKDDLYNVPEVKSKFTSLLKNIGFASLTSGLPFNLKGVTMGLLFANVYRTMAR